MTDQNKSVLEGIRELTSHIIARAAEIEAARRIPLDIVQSLISAGVFRMFVPGVTEDWNWHCQRGSKPSEHWAE
jgi:hypothetical protein